jgi:acetyl esterase/lipase
MKIVYQKSFVRKSILAAIISCAYIFSGCTDDSFLEATKSEIASAERLAANTYTTKSFTTSQLKISLNVPYSTKPNYNKIQYTADNRKSIDVGKSTLTIHLDIAVPPDASSSSKRPLVIYIHGGGYYKQEKERVRDEAFTYAQAGYIAATINYRLTPNNKSSKTLRQMAIRHALEDVGNAVRFLKSKASQYHIDASRIVLIGNSDGGALALMNAVGADELGLTSDYPSFTAKVKTAISTGATLTKEPDQPKLTYNSTDAPALVLHNSQTDPITNAKWQDAVNTNDKIDNSGNTCTLVKQPSNTHTVNLGVDGQYWDNNVFPFLQQHLQL